MGQKKKTGSSGYVYSTNPDFMLEVNQGSLISLPPAQQKLIIRLDTKHRAGKTVTLIEGFIGKGEDLEELAKKLKSFCGTGGSVKDAEIIIQGDQREKVLPWLLKNGFIHVKRSG
jgi:translation initiation factor 1